MKDKLKYYDKEYNGEITKFIDNFYNIYRVKKCYIYDSFLDCIELLNNLLDSKDLVFSLSCYIVSLSIYLSNFQNKDFSHCSNSLLRALLGEDWDLGAYYGVKYKPDLSQTREEQIIDRFNNYIYQSINAIPLGNALLIGIKNK